MANPYAAPADLANFMRASVLASIPLATQQAALDAAASTASGFLRSRYFLPLASHGQDLTRAVCNMAAYDLIFGRGFNPDGGGDPNWRHRYEDAVEWLKGVAKSTITPDGMVSGARTAPTDPSQLSGQTTVDDGSTNDDGSPAFVRGSGNQPRGW